MGKKKKTGGEKKPSGARLKRAEVNFWALVEKHRSFRMRSGRRSGASAREALGGDRRSGRDSHDQSRIGAHVKRPNPYRSGRRRRHAWARVHFSVDLVTGAVSVPEVMVTGLSVEKSAAAYAKASKTITAIRRATRGLK